MHQLSILTELKIINIYSMQNLLKRVKVAVVVLFLSLIVGNTTTQAQTPASVPGATPGISSSTGGDGSPEVPFDGEMSLILLASGISYVTKKAKCMSKTVI